MKVLAQISHHALFALATASIFSDVLVQSMTIPKSDGVKFSKKSSFTPIELDFNVVTKGNSTADEVYDSFISTRPWLQQTATDENGIKRRSSPLSSDLIYNINLYLMYIYLGSDNQPIEVAIDTGSSDLWVPTTNVTCAGYVQCKSYLTFNTSSSSTFESLGTVFQAGYADSSSSKGTWAKDSFSFTSSGAPLVPSVQFGAANFSSLEQGILGIAKEGQESGNTRYHNLPEVLVDDGLIAKNSYSLYLNSLDSSTGKLIFGGIDEEKYYGDLVALPIQKSGGYNNSLQVKLDSIQLSGLDNFTVDTPFVLDSGTTVTLLPSSVFSYLQNATHGTSSDSWLGNTIAVDCSYKTSTGSLTYNFDGVSIVVPIKDLVEDDFGGSCSLGVIESDTYSILGDNFLRSAYVYYDLTDNEISLAQAKYTDASNVVSA